MILTKFPLFSHLFYYFDSKTLKSSNLVDGEGRGVLLGVEGLVSKIFRGVAIRLQGGCYSSTLKGGLRGGLFLGFLSLRGVAQPPETPPPISRMIIC